jgi:hypothetical protein
VVRGRAPGLARGARLIGCDAADAFHVRLGHAERVRERRGLPAEQRLAGPLHPARELLAVTLDVLGHRAIDELGLVAAGQQRGVAHALLGRLVDLDR